MRYLLYLIFFATSLSATAQMPTDDEWKWGLKGGYTRSTFKDLKPTLIDPAQTYDWQHTKEYWRNGWTVSLFSHKRLGKTPFFYQAEGAFARLGGDSRNTSDSSLAYSHTQLKYDYVNLVPVFLNWHPGLPGDLIDAKAIHGLRVGVGLNFGIVLSDKITYESHEPLRNPATTQALNNGLKGVYDLSFLFGLGYEYYFRRNEFGFTIDVRYSLGLKDAIQTQQTPYYNETKVTTQALIATAGFMIPLSR